MDEMYKDPAFKARLEAALQEPKAPEALVNRTVARVKAIEEGREALRTLREAGSRLTKDVADTLAAKCVVGQLLQSNAPHANVDGAELAEQLKEVPAFRRITDLSPQEMIAKLSDGRTTRSIVNHFKAREERKAAPPVKEAPVKVRPNRSL